MRFGFSYVGLIYTAHRLNLQCDPTVDRQPSNFPGDTTVNPGGLQYI